jgi:hypothetical protein
VVGGWRLHNEELHNRYASSNIIKMIKSREMRWAGQVACMGEIRHAYEVWLENLKRRDHVEDLRVDGMIKL